MNRRSLLLATFLGAAALVARAATDETEVPFQGGLARLGTAVTQGHASSVLDVRGKFSIIEERSSVERADGTDLYDHPQAARSSSRAEADVAQLRPVRTEPRSEARPREAVVRLPIEVLLASESNLHLAEASTADPPPEPRVPQAAPHSHPPFSPNPVISADYFLVENEEPVVPTPAETPPPAPPAAVEIAPSTTPDQDWATATVSPRAGVTAPGLPPGLLDPRYRSTGEDSIYTSTCHRCGNEYCHCVYAPFGEAIRSAFGRQVYLGSAALMTLYAYDFHPAGTALQSELTSRGRYQLHKALSRLQYSPGQIKIEASGIFELDAERRVKIVAALAELGIPDADGLVVTIHTGSGRPAIESLETSYDLLESIRARGRTLSGAESSGFSGGGSLFGR